MANLNMDGGNELLFQHVQFRRIEKFMKNYLDPGEVTNEKISDKSAKVIQEINYIDKSVFRGEVVRDEETRFMYKEGQGRLIRNSERNYCYYKQMMGHWSRGIIHGKRTEIQMNLSVFPSGYL